MGIVFHDVKNKRVVSSNFVVRLLFYLCIPTPERCNLGVFSKTAVKLRRMCELVIASGFQASHGSHENYLTPLQ